MIYFKNSLSIMLVSISLLFLASCSLNPKLSIPPEVLAVNPEESCENIARPDAWNIKAKLTTVDDKNYLVIYYNPPFSTIDEPIVNLSSGPGAYQGQEGNLYYYSLGFVPKTVRIGTLSIVDRSRLRVMGQMKDEIHTFHMERREGTDCLVLIP